MKELGNIEAYWSDQAASFDEEPDHGLADPQVRAAWANLLARWIPPGPVRIADLGCGTGSLSVLLAESGAEVVGVDLSPAMIEVAERKAQVAGVDVEFTVGDVSDPDLPAESFDVVLSRHVLWNLPEPAAALEAWTRLLRPSGRLVSVEGRWSVDAGADEHEGHRDGGIPAAVLIDVLSGLFRRVDHYPLSDDSALWGKAVRDERYAIVARNAIGSATPWAPCPATSIERRVVRYHTSDDGGPARANRSDRRGRG